MVKQSTVSIIIPTLNAAKALPLCLKSIRSQTYSQNSIEIIVVDDNSKDETIKIANMFGAKVFKNGAKNIERGKSIGIKNAAGELLLFMDADNQLVGNDWLQKTVGAFLENPKAAGAEAIWFEYKPYRSAADRYCQLFGINDPFPLYLKRQDRLMFGEKSWSLGGKIVKETANYYLIEFEADNLPTVGSQGYLMSRKTVLKTSWKPYFFHMDVHTELLKKNPIQIVMLKQAVGHDHCENVFGFLKKVTRNGRLFLKQGKQRSFKYGSENSLLPIIIAGVKCLSIAIPLKDAILGFLRKKDPAWFLHPVICFSTAIIYLSLFVRWKLSL